MTKKDFELIARTLNAWRTQRYDVNDYDSRESFAYLVDDFADVLAETNPRFDRARFVAACGVTT